MHPDLTGFTPQRVDLDSVNQSHAGRLRFCRNLSGLSRRKVKSPHDHHPREFVSKWKRVTSREKLELAHKRLDEAVFAAYGWESTLSNEEILERLLQLNLERSKG
jgi:hypothetical protein